MRYMIPYNGRARVRNRISDHRNGNGVDVRIGQHTRTLKLSFTDRNRLQDRVSGMQDATGGPRLASGFQDLQVLVGRPRRLGMHPATPRDSHDRSRSRSPARRRRRSPASPAGSGACTRRAPWAKSFLRLANAGGSMTTTSNRARFFAKSSSTSEAWGLRAAHSGASTVVRAPASRGRAGIAATQHAQRNRVDERNGRQTHHAPGRRLSMCWRTWRRSALDSTSWSSIRRRLPRRKRLPKGARRVQAPEPAGDAGDRRRRRLVSCSCSYM